MEGCNHVLHGSQEPHEVGGDRESEDAERRHDERHERSWFEEEDEVLMRV